MPYGLQIFDASGNLTFDSTQAAGGVCLGQFAVARGQTNTFTFPDFGAGHQGFVVDDMSGSAGPYTYDEALGYPRFTFDSNNWGGIVLLFLK